MWKFMLFALVTVPAAGFAQSVPTGGLAHHDPFTVLPGKWGWAGSNDCASYPKVIHFSADRKLMYLSLAPVTPDGKREPRRQATYSILSVLPIGLSVSLHGENRRDATGKLVTWDLIIMDKNQLCWHRSDWPQYGCTKSIYHCQNLTNP